MRSWARVGLFWIVSLASALSIQAGETREDVVAQQSVPAETNHAGKAVAPVGSTASAIPATPVDQSITFPPAQMTRPATMPVGKVMLFQIGVAALLVFGLGGILLMLLLRFVGHVLLPVLLQKEATASPVMTTRSRDLAVDEPDKT